MQLLTADIMEELVEFQNKMNIKYDIYINNNNIYLRFYCGEMFEPASIKKGSIETNTIEKYFNILNFTYVLFNKLINIIDNVEI